MTKIKEWPSCFAVLYFWNWFLFIVENYGSQWFVSKNGKFTINHFNCFTIHLTYTYVVTWRTNKNSRPDSHRSTKVKNFDVCEVQDVYVTDCWQLKIKAKSLMQRTKEYQHSDAVYLLSLGDFRCDSLTATLQLKGWTKSLAVEAVRFLTCFEIDRGLRNSILDDQNRFYSRSVAF